MRPVCGLHTRNRSTACIAAYVYTSYTFFNFLTLWRSTHKASGVRLSAYLPGAIFGHLSLAELQPCYQTPVTHRA